MVFAISGLALCLAAGSQLHEDLLTAASLFVAGFALTFHGIGILL